MIEISRNLFPVSRFLKQDIARKRQKLLLGAEVDAGEVRITLTSRCMAMPAGVRDSPSLFRLNS